MHTQSYRGRGGLVTLVILVRDGIIPGLLTSQVSQQGGPSQYTLYQYIETVWTNNYKTTKDGTL